MKGKKTLAKATPGRTTTATPDGAPAESAGLGRGDTLKEQAKSRAKDRVIAVPYIELSSENSFKVGKNQGGLDLWVVCKCLVTGILPKVRVRRHAAGSVVTALTYSHAVTCGGRTRAMSPPCATVSEVVDANVWPGKRHVWATGQSLSPHTHQETVAEEPWRGTG